MQRNGAIWPEKGFRLLLCARGEKADLNPSTMLSLLVISEIRNRVWTQFISYLSPGPTLPLKDKSWQMRVKDVVLLLSSLLT